MKKFICVLLLVYSIAVRATQDTRTCTANCRGINAILDELPFVQASSRVKRAVNSYVDERSCVTSSGRRGFHCDDKLTTGDDQVGLRTHTDEVCGIQRASNVLKVTNRAGSEDSPGSWPWMASYGKREVDRRWTHLCGGTIVSQDTVLTAAHCFNGRDHLWVRLGDTDLSDRFDDVNAFDIAVSAVIRHPKYVSNQAYYDVALLRLERKVEYTDYIVPVCLPELPSPYANTHQGKLVTLTGWGKAERNSAVSDSYLQRIHLGIFSQKYCNDSYNLPESHNLYRDSHGLVPRLFHSTVICAGYERGGLGSCKGDSGGPLVRYRTHTRRPSYEQVGIVSGGIGRCGDLSFPGVYVRVDDGEILQFIRRGAGLDALTSDDGVRTGDSDQGSVNPATEEIDNDNGEAPKNEKSFCFLSGRCNESSFFINSWPVADAESCLRQCQASEGCNYFTFRGGDSGKKKGGEEGLCLGFGDCIELETDSCKNCVSGKVTCTVEEEDTPTHMAVIPSEEDSGKTVIALLGGYADLHTRDTIDLVTEKGSCRSGLRMPEKRTMMFAVEVEEEEYIIACGGIVEGIVPDQSCFKLSKNSTVWEYADPIPEGLRLAANAVVGNKWYVVSDHAVYRYIDGEGWSDASYESKGGYNGCAVGTDSGFILTGGYRIGLFTQSDESHFFDATSNSWSDELTYPLMNHGRALHACAILPSSAGRLAGMVVVGGVNMATDDAVRTVELLAPSAKIWTELGELKYPRHGRPVVGSFGDGKRLFVTGGINLGIKRSFKNVEELVQDKEGKWEWKIRDEEFWLEKGKSRYGALTTSSAYFGTCL